MKKIDFRQRAAKTEERKRKSKYADVMVRATVIEDYAFTITTRQDRTPAQVIDCGNGRYRYLTELECWRLQGYTDEDFERAKKAQQKKGRYYTALYKQAGNSIAVPIFESIFRKIILNEVREKEEQR